MFTCNFTNKFKKDYKRAVKRGWDMNLFDNVYDLLAEKGELPQNYKPHALAGNSIIQLRISLKFLNLQTIEYCLPFKKTLNERKRN